MLARTQAASRRFTADMTAHRIQKQYKVSACIMKDSLCCYSLTLSQSLQALHTSALSAFSKLLSALGYGG